MNSCPLTFVYWIHLPTHTDKSTQGYIGVSNNPQRRYRDHLNQASKTPNNPLSNAITLYKDKLIYSIIYIGSEQSCYSLEQSLRPKSFIGWNYLRKQAKSKLTPEGRDKISQARKGKPLPPFKCERIRWNNYKRKHGHITLDKFRVVDALKRKTIPVSKSNLPVFNLSTNESYTNISIAASNTNTDAFDIFLSCHNKSGNWIYLSQL